MLCYRKVYIKEVVQWLGIFNICIYNVDRIKSTTNPTIVKQEAYKEASNSAVKKITSNRKNYLPRASAVVDN